DFSASLRRPLPCVYFFSAPPSPESSTLSLHDALPIFSRLRLARRNERLEPLAETALAGRSLRAFAWCWAICCHDEVTTPDETVRSEEHTSELQSRENLVCRLLLEKKKQKYKKLLPQTG